MFIKRMGIFGKVFGSKEAKVAAAVAAAVTAEGALHNTAEASTKHHKIDDRSAVVERHELSGMAGAIQFALDKATEGRDEKTGTITENQYTVSFERKEKNSPLVANVTFEENGKKETKRIIVGEQKIGADKNSNNIYKKVALGDADVHEELAELRDEFKKMEAASDNQNNRIAEKE